MEKNDATDKANVTKATWMADGTHWPGTWLTPTADHSKGDHAGILQVARYYFSTNFSFTNPIIEHILHAEFLDIHR